MSPVLLSRLVFTIIFFPMNMSTQLLVFALACAILLNCYVEATKVLGASRLLKQYPMILSHDAATSMLDKKLSVVEAYTQTQQDGLLSSQLSCGARAFDYRPFLRKDGSLVAHHGSVQVPVLSRDSTEDIISWLAQPAHSDELVLLYLSHFQADGETDTQESQRCIDATATLLKDMGIASIGYGGDCSPLATLTVSEAVSRGHLPSGGSLLAVFDCVNENFNPKVNCWGMNGIHEYSCYGKNRDVAWGAMQSYVNSTAIPLATPADNLWMLQAHWQSSDESVPLGDLHHSSVLKDEKEAGVNAWLAQTLRDRALPFETLNLVELDNVCDGGLEVLAALQGAYM